MWALHVPEGGTYDEVRRSVCALAGPSLAPGGTVPARGRPANDRRRSPAVRRRGGKICFVVADVQCTFPPSKRGPEPCGGASVGGGRWN